MRHKFEPMDYIPYRIADARRKLNNFRSFVRRDNLTGWVDRNAAPQYRASLEAIIAVEDLAGIDAAAKLSDRLSALRDEAQRAGLLSPEDISTAEDAAIQNRDRAISQGR